jgi:hypothetical protein
LFLSHPHAIIAALWKISPPGVGDSGMLLQAAGVMAWVLREAGPPARKGHGYAWTPAPATGPKACAGADVGIGLDMAGHPRRLLLTRV